VHLIGRLPAGQEDRATMLLSQTIPTSMPLNLDQLTKPAHKLRKLLRNFEDIPSPDQVHSLRTQFRRIEANLKAVGFEGTRTGHRLLKTISPIRRRAGKVRDMDVLSEFAAELSIENNVRNREFGDAPIRLLQQIGVNRFHHAKRLCHVISSERKSALRRLKRFSRWANDHRKHNGHPLGKVARWQTDPTSMAINLSSSLAQWPELDRENLHAFRLRVKELRNVLNLSSIPNRKLTHSLSKVKDAIGAWHDWCELESIARQQVKDCDRLCRRIHSIAEDKLHHALALAANLRTSYFNEATGRNRPAKPIQLKRPVLISAAQMGA
jgi:CHAD domain-containing protein